MTTKTRAATAATVTAPEATELPVALAEMIPHRRPRVDAPATVEQLWEELHRLRATLRYERKAHFMTKLTLAGYQLRERHERAKREERQRYVAEVRQNALAALLPRRYGKATNG